MWVFQNHAVLLHTTLGNLSTSSIFGRVMGRVMLTAIAFLLGSVGIPGGSFSGSLAQSAWGQDTADPVKNSLYGSNGIHPNDIAGYRYIQRTIYVNEPVKVEKWVEETEMVTEKRVEHKHVINTEQRERRRTVRKPVTRTTIKEERRTVRKPITETKYREREVQQTRFETSTEMREERVVVQRPVIETAFRDEQVTVRRQVSENLIEVTNQTVLRPQSTTETALVPLQWQNTYTDMSARPRLQWLSRGQYTDPAAGTTVYRRPGLHWVQPTNTVNQTAFLPTTVERQQWVPESIQTRRPVEISRFEDQVETRRVPFEVQRMVSETEIRQTPVTVRKPVVERFVERIPYTETRYEFVEEIRSVPVEETVFEDVVEIEPYEVEVARWVPVTTEVEVPRTVRRKVASTEDREVAKTIWVRVPVDSQGRILGNGEPVSETEALSSGRNVGGDGSTSTQLEESRFKAIWNGSNATGSTESGRRLGSIVVPESAENSSKADSLKSLNQGSSNEQSVPSDRPQSKPADIPPTLNSVLELDSPDERSQQQLRDLERLTVYRPGIDLEIDLIQPQSKPKFSPNHRQDIIATEKSN